MNLLKVTFKNRKNSERGSAFLELGLAMSFVLILAVGATTRAGTSVQAVFKATNDEISAGGSSSTVNVGSDAPPPGTENPLNPFHIGF